MAKRRAWGVKYDSAHVRLPFLPYFLKHIEKADDGVSRSPVRPGEFGEGVECPEHETVPVDEKQFFPLHGDHILFFFFGPFIVLTGL